MISPTTKHGTLVRFSKPKLFWDKQSTYTASLMLAENGIYTVDRIIFATDDGKVLLREVPTIYFNINHFTYLDERLNDEYRAHYLYPRV